MAAMGHLQTSILNRFESVERHPFETCFGYGPRPDRNELQQPFPFCVGGRFVSLYEQQKKGDPGAAFPGGLRVIG